MSYSDQNIIIYYPVGAGGKFIMNSLGLSKHCVLHDFELALWDIAQTDFDDRYYDYKLDRILDTVPNVARSTDWQKHELAGGTCWPFPWCTDEIPVKFTPIISSGKKFCSIAHEASDIDLYTKWSTGRVIKLTNYIQWMTLSRFKVKGLDQDLENKISYWTWTDRNEKLSIDPILVDMQYMNSVQYMQQEIKKLYSAFGFEDFDQQRWIHYYTAYTKSHET